MARRSNCFFFAFWLWVTRGGYFCVRRSHHITGWHWLWSPDLRRWIHYEPVRPCTNWACAVFHKLWYTGRIMRGDVPMTKTPPRPHFWLRARDAITGRFVRLADALKRKATTIVEKMKRI